MLTLCWLSLLILSGNVKRRAIEQEKEREDSIQTFAQIKRCARRDLCGRLNTFVRDACHVRQVLTWSRILDLVLVSVFCCIGFPQLLRKVNQVPCPLYTFPSGCPASPGYEWLHGRENFFILLKMSVAQTAESFASAH